MNGDRNFDDLAERFERKIHGGLKGEIRLQVVLRDFAEHLPIQGRPLRVLDAGGGQGQLALHFARLGHQVTLCDISSNMLAVARRNVAREELDSRIDIVEQPIQSLMGQFDLVLCHAVLEWVEQPAALLQHLANLVASGGYLSLTYYNVNGLIYKNLLRGNFKKISRRQFHGRKGSLTPPRPLSPDDVRCWLHALPFQTLCESGIRVFHDYILQHENPARHAEASELVKLEVMKLELEYSRRMPFRDLGRYLHWLGSKTNGP